MRKIILLIVYLTFFIVSIEKEGFPQDNTYGDFLISKSKKNISLEVENVSFLDVLRLFSQQTGLNFVSLESVKERNLTLQLENVPLRQTMDVLFTANNLTYDYYPDSNIFVVKELGKPAMELKTKIFYLKYARVSSSQIQGIGAGGAAKGSIVETMQKVLTEFGKITEDRFTNSLIITDSPSQFHIIEEVIRKLDIPLPQVMIEVEMLDVSKSTIDKLGVRWPQSLGNLDITGKRGTSFPWIGKHKPKTEGFIWSELTSPGGVDISGVSTHDFAPTVLTLIGAQLALDFFKSQSDTKNLARPKIITLSNETAEIKISSNEAIGIKETQSTQGGTTNFTVEREKTGTTLKVTPQVDKNTRSITLSVDMSVTTTRDSGFTSKIFIEGTLKDPEERGTKAILRLKDGETLLLGGLIKTESSNAKRKVPFFSKVPLFGAMFRHKDRIIEERELLVFLTPRIMDESPILLKTAKSIKREQANPLKNYAIKNTLDKFSE